MTTTQGKGAIRRKKTLPGPGLAHGPAASQLYRSMGNEALSSYLFSSFRVSDPAEPKEIEADRAADRVMAGEQVHTDRPGGGDSALSHSAGEETLSRSAAGGDQSQSAAGGEPEESGAGGPGGLAGGVREKMEGAFGRSFAGVRLHHDSHADTLSRALHADAFTQGSDIYFRDGAYSPGTRDGQHLIAHELAHVDQADGGKIMRALTQKEIIEYKEDDPKLLEFLKLIIKHRGIVESAIWAQDLESTDVIGKSLDVASSVVNTVSSSSKVYASQLVKPTEPKKTEAEYAEKNAEYAKKKKEYDGDKRTADIVSTVGSTASTVVSLAKAGKSIKNFVKAPGAEALRQYKKEGEILKIEEEKSKLVNQWENEKFDNFVGRNTALKAAFETVKAEDLHKERRIILDNINIMLNSKADANGVKKAKREAFFKQAAALRKALRQNSAADRTKSIGYQSMSDKRASSWSGMATSVFGAIGSALSTSGLIWSLAGGAFGGGIMSAVGGLVSTVCGLVSSGIGLHNERKKEKNKVDNRNKKNKAHQFAYKVLSTLSTNAAGLTESEVNGVDPAKLDKISNLTEQYDEMRSKGVDMEKFKKELETTSMDDSAGLKKILVETCVL